MNFKEMMQESLNNTEAGLRLSNMLMLRYLVKNNVIVVENNVIEFEVAELQAESERDGVVVTVYFKQGIDPLDVSSDKEKENISINIIIDKKDVLQSINNVLDYNRDNILINILFQYMVGRKFDVDDYLVCAVESLIEGGDLYSLIDTFLKYDCPFEELAQLKKLTDSISNFLNLEKVSEKLKDKYNELHTELRKKWFITWCRVETQVRKGDARKLTGLAKAIKEEGDIYENLSAGESGPAFRESVINIFKDAIPKYTDKDAMPEYKDSRKAVLMSRLHEAINNLRLTKTETGVTQGEKAGAGLFCKAGAAGPNTDELKKPTAQPRC